MRKATPPTDPAPVTHAENPRVPDGAAWTQHHVTTADGAELHADDLLPQGLAPGERVPVVLAVGPCFGYSGQQTVDRSSAGPSERFTDLLAGGDLLGRGYALVQVDSRGFGVPPAASTSPDPPSSSTSGPRSTGPPASPGPPAPLDSGWKYLGNAAYEFTHPNCVFDYVESYQDPDPNAEVWRQRDLVDGAVGTDTPLFITQGFLEWNTDAEGVEEFLADHDGPERGWLGQWALTYYTEQLPVGGPTFRVPDGS